MYILFKAVTTQVQGNIQTIGRVLTYTVGYIPDTHVDILNYVHLDPTVLEDSVAEAWLFFDSVKNKISVRPATLQNQRLDLISSAEATGEKVKYFLTETDQQNALKFSQVIMRKILDEIYDKRFIQFNANASVLETSTWLPQQAEATAYLADNTASVPLITSLAQARDITVAEMANKIINAIADYNSKLSTLLAKKQLVEKEIKSCQSIEDCKRLMHSRFDISMPVSQMTEEGVTTSSKFDL